MGETKTVIYDWREIFRAFKMAFDPKKMFLGYLGLLASLIWCMAAVAFFSALKMVSANPFAFVKLVLYSAREGAPLAIKNALLAIMPLDFGEFVVLGVLVFGLLVIWSLIAGAITRIAALDYARDESVSLLDALGFARKKLWSYFWSPVVPVIGVFFFALCNVVGGMIGRIPVLGEIAVALGFPLAILSGFLMVFIGVIGALGLCLMFPTISAEGSDAFDAMSRAYSYVISRPKQFLWYCVVNTVYGLACLAVIAFVAWLMMRLSFCTVGLGMGQKFASVQSFILQKCDLACLGFCTAHSADAQSSAISLDRWSLKFLAGMLILYVGLIKLAVWTFAVTYLLSAKTIIYFLLRKEIDSTDVTDVYADEQKEGKTEAEKKEISSPSEGAKEDRASTGEGV